MQKEQLHYCNRTIIKTAATGFYPDLSGLPLLTQYHRRDWAYPPAGGSEWKEVEGVILPGLKHHSFYTL